MPAAPGSASSARCLTQPALAAAARPGSTRRRRAQRASRLARQPGAGAASRLGEAKPSRPKAPLRGACRVGARRESSVGELPERSRAPRRQDAPPPRPRRRGLRVEAGDEVAVAGSGPRVAGRRHGLARRSEIATTPPPESDLAAREEPRAVSPCSAARAIMRARAPTARRDLQLCLGPKPMYFLPPPPARQARPRSRRRASASVRARLVCASALAIGEAPRTHASAPLVAHA